LVNIKINIAIGIHWPLPVSLQAKLQFSVNSILALGFRAAN